LPICIHVRARVIKARARIRSAEAGFGLVELLIAMTVLMIGVLAIAAAFSSSAVALRRASRISTAAALADSQIELYRAIKYTNIGLDPATIPGTAPYTSDAAYPGCCVTTPPCGAPECNASRTTPGADGINYRVDTYIVSDTPPAGRPYKKVTVVVRDAANTAITYARVITTFDQTTGS
jgi:type II secretory pathway pseudopilin PulG